MRKLSRPIVQVTPLFASIICILDSSFNLRHSFRATNEGRRMATVTKNDLEKLLGTVFAPWIQDMGLEIIELDEDGGLFRLPTNENLARNSGPDTQSILCGQAIAAAADTVSVLALIHLNQRFRNVTTVDLTTHFMRPLMLGPVDIRIEAISNGRRMAVTRAEFRAEGATKIAATATLAFAYLED